MGCVGKRFSLRDIIRHASAVHSNLQPSIPTLYVACEGHFSSFRLNLSKANHPYKKTLPAALVDVDQGRTPTLDSK